MINVCIICDYALSDPEVTVIDDNVEFATFDLNISIDNTSYGWMKILCTKENAEFAACHIRTGTKVQVIGNLIRSSFKKGKDVWWHENRVAVLHLQLAS